MSNSAMSIEQIHAHSLLATTFDHPRQVLASPFLDQAQKRCVLAAWASDAFAVEGRPWLRQIPGSSRAISIGDILSTLRTLDGDDSPPAISQRMPRPSPAKRTRAIGQTAFEVKRLRADIHV
jgi:hypothetical protein